MWNKYSRTGVVELRPYVPGEDLTDIGVSKELTPKLGGMIARDINNHKDKWYISEAHFKQNFKIIEDGII